MIGRRHQLPTLEGLWLRSLERGSPRCVLWPVLAMVALLFHAARLAKFTWFRMRLFPFTRSVAMTVSIGNVAIGGTGKTPVTRLIARILSEELGIATAVLCRGYASRNREWVRVVSREGVLAPDAAAGGDEALLLARTLPRATVIVGKRRALTARAAERLGCQAIVLDDGFQYWRLARDLDVVCFSTEAPMEHYRLFPLGILREPMSRVRDADLVVLTGEGEAAGELLARIGEVNSRVPVLRAVWQPRGLSRPAAFEIELPPAGLAGKGVLAVSNMAGPRRFWRTLEAAGVARLVPMPFSDHHAYSPADMAAVERELAGQELDFAVATEKDEPSLLELPELPGKLRILRGDLELAGDGARLLRSQLEKLATRFGAGHPWDAESR